LVANIKAALSEDDKWKGKRKKDPGKRVKRREAKMDWDEDDWCNERVAAPTTRSGRKAKGGDSVSAGTRSGGRAKAGDVIPAKAKARAKVGKGAPVKVIARKKKPDQGLQGKGEEVDSGAPSEGASVNQNEGELEDLEGEEPIGGGEEVMEGQPLRRRGSHTSELVLSDGDEKDEESDEWSDQEDHELEDNLTYYEDSLSVLRGTAMTPLGEEVRIWVTTDTGSMTSLMQAQYAKRLKLKRRQIPKGKTFYINGPGGGRDEIEEYVVLKLRVTCKEELIAEQGYDDCASEEVVHTVKMKFGLCESLPVPVLWGGKQMRDAGLLDYHQQKTLSVRLNGRRYCTPSCSWLVATMEMGTEVSGKALKALRPFIPSKERLANMVVGGRKAINMPAILYPGKDNVVRVGRHNARIDEGYNEVLVENRDEFALTYGEWVVPIECVTNGEAFVIVRNNADRPIRLMPGALKLSVNPAVSIPTRVVAPRDVLNSELTKDQQVSGETRQSLEEEREVPRVLSMAALAERGDPAEEEAYARSPHHFMT
jgi:hypothetical protein